jgi:hypothetical protein
MTLDCERDRLAERKACGAKDSDPSWSRPRRVKTATEVGGYFLFKERHAEEDNFSPLYAIGTEGNDIKGRKNEQDMELVRQTMLSAEVHDVVAKVDLAGQNLLVASNKNDPQNLLRRSPF